MIQQWLGWRSLRCPNPNMVFIANARLSFCKDKIFVQARWLCDRQLGWRHWHGNRAVEFLVWWLLWSGDSQFSLMKISLSNIFITCPLPLWLNAMHIPYSSFNFELSICKTLVSTFHWVRNRYKSSSQVAYAVKSSLPDSHMRHLADDNINILYVWR